MSGAGHLELRILSGIHEGAVAALGDAALVLGSGADCDIVLADAGVQARHARLEPADGGWLLMVEPASGGADGAPPVPLAPGLAATVGPVLLTVELAAAPWRAPEQLKLAASGPAGLAGESPAQAAAIIPAVQAIAAPAPAGQNDLGPAPAATEPVPVMPPVPATGSRRRSVSMIVVGLLLLFAAAALLAWALQPPPQPAVAVAVAVAPVAAGGPADAPAIQAVIDSLALGQRAVVEGKPGDWLVRATYLNDAEIESLAAALSKLRPRPGLRIRSEQDLQQDVAEALGRLVPGQPGRVKASYLGEARFRLEGRLDTPLERQAVVDGLRAAFPQVRDWDNQLLVPQDQAQRLLEQLRSAGFEGVTGRWQDGKLYIEAKVLSQQVPQWERALMQAVARYPVPISATLAPQRQAQDLAMARLPFQLRSVMGGEMPYVVLADGGKLLEGGSRQGWRLVSVDGEKVVFENGTRRAIVPR